MLRLRSGIEVELSGPVSLDLAMEEPPDRRFVVGYALEKEQSFIQPSLVGTARDRGVDLVPIDHLRPLVEQGPFDCVVHNLHGDEWNIQIADFAAKNPDVPIVDQPLAVERLDIRYRTAVLQFDSDINVTQIYGIPNQMLIYDSSSDAFSVITHIRSPIDANPRASGGGVAFKVYVAGNHVQCVRTNNCLPDVAPEQHTPVLSVACFRVSNSPFHIPEDAEYVKHPEAAEPPPSSFFEKIAMRLRQVTELRLFTFDIIRDAKSRKHYYLIDVNYFPDYSEMPGYEEFLTNFFWDMVHQKGESAAASSSFSSED
ncbi:inositol-tetrakisphosphate 1-kinase 1-like [Zingiber officinale]|uniref:Inositol-tetrakisphosphate 1-kinase n=1 Tax=Zingiber officinale TaxID=94328 RepID=A0A8J5LP87_ZINOF|nr:inositol-tetrakisphosphate 1-kinase 1-like [Zingiber officinale]KAG6528110.1 hypothetical protein ZIOFF_010259 [Zingiber officinale]